MTVPVDLSDQNDIKSCLAGDEAAFTRLVNRYQGIIGSQMRRFTNDEYELDELVQEVFVQAWFSLPGYKSKAPFVHWLRKIATRVGYKFWKKRGREKTGKKIISNEMILDLDNVDQLEPSEAAERLKETLAALKPKDRLVLTLYYFEDRDTSEIARMTGWSLTLVKVRMHRARNRLKTLLTGVSNKKGDER